MTTERMDVVRFPPACRRCRDPTAIGIAAGVGIDQDFVPVESLPGESKPAIDAIGVVRARFQTAHKGVPDSGRSCLHRDRTEWFETALTRRARRTGAVRRRLHSRKRVRSSLPKGKAWLLADGQTRPQPEMDLALCFQRKAG